VVDKKAITEYPIEELLARRWSPRAFSERRVEPEKLLSLLEAARWAPSCFNEQPWSFLVVTKEDTAAYDRLLKCLVEANRRWAVSAPVLMLSVTRLHFARNNKVNRYAFHDVGLAVGTLLVQASAMGLYVHQMAGFDQERAQEVLEIPETHKAVAAIALGYLGDPAQLPEDLRDRELQARERKPLSGFVYGGGWEKPSSLPGVNPEFA
jgi:nitroreductase